MTSPHRVELATGVALNVAFAGAEDAPPVMLLHGFPESHRTWRRIAPLLDHRFRLIMPDQRGFGGSDCPPMVEDYRIEKIVEDVFALADALKVENFALVGHDWGGATAWAAALRGDPRLTRLAAINAPHPVIFQKSLIEDEDQRAASQYINAFRNPGFEKAVEAMGYEAFFAKSFGGHVDIDTIPAEERLRYISDWSRPGALTAMLNWYRASPIVVPLPGAVAVPPDFLSGAFPPLAAPTLVIWGMRDKALLPIQLEGLDALVEDLTIVRVPDAGHFVPWEAPGEVAAALEGFLA